MAGTCAVLASCALAGYFAFEMAAGGRQARAIAATAREIVDEPVLRDWEDDLDTAIETTRRAAAHAAWTANEVAQLAFLGSWILAIIAAASLSVFLLGSRARAATSSAVCPSCPVRPCRLRLV